VCALAAIEQLRVDVHRQLGVGVPDLALHERDVEVRRQEHHRDVRAAHRVWRDMRQRREAIRHELLAGEASTSVEESFAHVALVPACPLAGAEERALGLDGVAAANLLGTVGEQDVNGDGRGDILLTAPRQGFQCASAGSGPCGNAPRDAYVIYGKADQGTIDLAHLHRSQGFVIRGAEGGLNGGIAGLGRFDGSRYGGIAVDSIRYTYVIYGGRNPANVDLAHVGSRGFRITAGGPQAGPLGVAAAGDVNGDGRPDLLLYKGSTARQPFVFVLFGCHCSGTISAYHLGSRGFAIRGAGSGAGVGDVNGDHRADLLVERVGFEGREHEELDLVHGSASSRPVDLASLGSRGARIYYGPAPSGRILQLNTLAGLGDLNSDGRADFGVSTETYQHGNVVTVQSTVSVVFGSRRTRSLSLQNLGAAGYQLTVVVATPSCPMTSAGAELGRGLTALGDFSGTGRPEFALTAAGLGPAADGSCSLSGGEVLIETVPSR
jgi:hypothetical protein